MPRQIADNFAATHGLAHKSDFLQVKLLDDRRHIVREQIEIAASVRFAGTAVASTVVRNAANSLACQAIYLILPPSGMHGPRGGKEHWLSGTGISEGQICTVRRFDKIMSRLLATGLFASRSVHLVQPIRADCSGTAYESCDGFKEASSEHSRVPPSQLFTQSVEIVHNLGGYRQREGAEQMLT